MNLNRLSIMTDTRKLTISAFAIALVLVSFTLFKSTTNLLNAIFVPLALAVMLYRMPSKQRIMASITAYLIVLILFPTQIVYMSVYIGLAFVLVQPNPKSTILMWLIKISAFAFILFIATIITDTLFMLQINTFVSKITQGNVLFFTGFYVFESVFVLGIVSFVMQRIIKIKRLND